MSSRLPLISCICITKNSTILLHRAVQCFLAQSYPNKELLLVFESDNEATALHCRSAKYPSSVRVLMTIPGEPLGSLRNYAINQSNGKLFCQWDDDDWYHVKRLELQFNAIEASHTKACVINRWVLFDSVRGNAFISGRRLWEGSLLCYKEMMSQVQYPSLRQGEDTAFVYFLAANKLLYIMENVPYLYIYTFHGNNTFGAAHFSELFEDGLTLASETNREIADILAPGSAVEAGSKRLTELLSQT